MGSSNICIRSGIRMQAEPMHRFALHIHVQLIDESSMMISKDLRAYFNTAWCEFIVALASRQTAVQDRK